MFFIYLFIYLFFQIRVPNSSWMHFCVHVSFNQAVNRRLQKLKETGWFCWKVLGRLICWVGRFEPFGGRGGLAQKKNISRFRILRRWYLCCRSRTFFRSFVYSSTSVVGWLVGSFKFTFLWIFFNLQVILVNSLAMQMKSKQNLQR